MWIKKSEYDELKEKEKRNKELIDFFISHCKNKTYYILPSCDDDGCCTVFYYLDGHYYTKQFFHDWELNSYCKALDANGWKQIDKPVF